MVAAAAVASVVALYMLWDWLLREGPTRFSTLLAITLLLGYGLGAVNTWLTLPRGHLTLAEFLGSDEGVLARGMAGVLLSAAPLCLFGELYERPLFGREFRIPLDQQTYMLIFLGTVATVIGFVTGSLGYMGVQNTYGEQQSVSAALLSWLSPPLTALAISVFVATSRGFSKLLTGLCVFVLCACLMVVGRRIMVYTAMEVFFALRLTGYRLKGTFFKKALLFLALGGFLAIGVTVFMLIPYCVIVARRAARCALLFAPHSQREARPGHAGERGPPHPQNSPSRSAHCPRRKFVQRLMGMGPRGSQSSRNNMRLGVVNYGW